MIAYAVNYHRTSATNIHCVAKSSYQTMVLASWYSQADSRWHNDALINCVTDCKCDYIHTYQCHIKLQWYSHCSYCIRQWQYTWQV